ncbi:MAG: hypothetical protein ACREBG_21945 [Pyrinomonadaceae bacterium]
MQTELLAKYPSSELRVYVLWFSMIATDARSAWRWTGNVITDPRVIHFWDDQKVIGRWFAAQDNPEESDPGIVWDAFFLYGPDARWDGALQPPLSRGATVLDEYDTLEKSLLPLLKKK